MKTEYIRFLRDCSCSKSYVWQCGDGCCFEYRWDNENFLTGETVENDEWEIDISKLILGIDYEIFEE